MGLLDRIRARLSDLVRAEPTIAERAAPKIEAQFKADATTKRGNIPSYGKFGDIPITVVPDGNGVKVNAADWVMDKARELDQPAKWGEIFADEARAALRGDK